MILEQLTYFRYCEVSLIHSPNHYALSPSGGSGSCTSSKDITLTKYGNCPHRSSNLVEDQKVNNQ